LINKYMKINEVIQEGVNDVEDFVSGDMIDPQLSELKKRERMHDEGIDPDTAEIVQDFPI